MLEKPFVSYLSNSIIKNWNFPALAYYNGESFSYSDVGVYIQRNHQLYKELGIKHGDELAIVGKNSARWGILYLSIVTYGAVVFACNMEIRNETSWLLRISPALSLATA